jgi:maltose O-acetyltransferase
MPLSSSARERPQWVPPREFLLNQFVSQLPWMRLRVAGYERLGVTFEDSSTAAVMMKTDVHAPRQISIGRGSIIGRHCLLDGRGGLEIGSDVNVSSYSLLISASHDPYDDDFAGYQAGVVIEDKAWIATRATILAGVRVGFGAVVAAGAVVTRDVEPFAVVAGVPAKPIGKRPETIRYGLNYRPNYL